MPFPLFLEAWGRTAVFSKSGSLQSNFDAFVAIVCLNKYYEANNMPCGIWFVKSSTALVLVTE